MTAEQKRILLVEDDAALNDAFSMVLESQGYEVVRAYNGQEALDILKDTPVDLILLDLLMPVLDGKEFLQTYENTKGIPIIVFSNLDAKSEINEVIELGASRYMLKAWATPTELSKVINDTLR